MLESPMHMLQTTSPMHFPHTSPGFIISCSCFLSLANLSFAIFILCPPLIYFQGSISPSPLHNPCLSGPTFTERCPDKNFISIHKKGHFSFFVLKLCDFETPLPEGGNPGPAGSEFELCFTAKQEKNYPGEKRAENSHALVSHQPDVIWEAPTNLKMQPVLTVCIISHAN